MLRIVHCRYCAQAACLVKYMTISDSCRLFDDSKICFTNTCYSHVSYVDWSIMWPAQDLRVSVHSKDDLLLLMQISCRPLDHVLLLPFEILQYRFSTSLPTFWLFWSYSQLHLASEQHRQERKRLRIKYHPCSLAYRWVHWAVIVWTLKQFSAQSQISAVIHFKKRVNQDSRHNTLTLWKWPTFILVSIKQSDVLIVLCVSGLK